MDYEAIVADLQAEARRMLGFLGLPWNDACLRFHETERPVRTASVNQVRQPGLSIFGWPLARARGATSAAAGRAGHAGGMMQAVATAGPSTR